jgi:hypothetical protein
MEQKIKRESMRRTFLIHHIPVFKGWEICFRSIMEKSDTFRIIFQGNEDASDADDLLNAGKQEFLYLPALTISPYAGMANSIEVTGELNKAARELFLTFMTPAFGGYKPGLWSFQFLQGDDALLRIEDFTVALLFLEESEVEELLAQGIDGANLEEIDNFSAEAPQPDVEVMNWNKEELAFLTSQLKESFLAKYKNKLTPPEDSNHSNAGAES